MRKHGGLDLVPYDFALPADESASDEDADTRPSKRRKHDNQAAESQRACGAAHGGLGRGARGPAGDVREASAWSEPVVISSDELSSGDDAHSPVGEMAEMNPPRARLVADQEVPSSAWSTPSSHSSSQRPVSVHGSLSITQQAAQSELATPQRPIHSPGLMRPPAVGSGPRPQSSR